MSISLRIKRLADEKKMSIMTFEKEISAANGTIGTILKRNSNVSGNIMVNILNRFPEIDANWLILGKGSMYLSDHTTQHQPCTDCTTHKRTIQDLQDLASLYRDKVAQLEEKLAICEKRLHPAPILPQKTKNK